MHLLNGGRIAAHIRAELTVAIAASSIRPHLSSVRVGDDPASAMYLRAKERACAEVGITCSRHDFPGTVATEALVGRIRSLNDDASVHGILVQLPLPHAIETDGVIAAVDPAKDVDGFHEINMGRLLTGQEGLVPCTPLGIMKLLEHYHIPVEGRFAVVVGRSNIVGKPVAMMLLQRNATVTLCHTRTKNMEEVCRMADILIAAAGRPGMITADMIREGAVVIDVGINRLDTGKLAGDVDFESASKKAGWITPVPGGVGPMTIAMLLYNTVKAAKMAAGGI